MAAPRLELPILQNWSCHNCGGCCRQHLIEVTEVESRRILDQKWTSEDGIHQPVLKWYAGPPWRKRYQLAHQPDGGCAFLDERGLCRIHAKFGESAKPLACRVYPYAIHPKGKSFVVSLRYSCPSVVANKGSPVTSQSNELRKLAEAVIPAGGEKRSAPRLTRNDRVDWPDFLPFVEALDRTLADPTAPLAVRIVRAVTWTSLVGQSAFEKIRGPRIRELIGLLMEAARIELPSLPDVFDEPSSMGRLYFRTLVAQYARKDTVTDLSAGLWGRWKLLRAILKFARGTGAVPPLQAAFQSVPFESLEPSFGTLDPEFDSILTRYFRVKVQGLHFCGPAYYDVPFAEGFHSLALMLPVTLWLARWLCVGDGRDRLTVTDVSTALSIADHHHGYSPVLGQSAARSRVRWLAEAGDLSRLCLWYSR